MDDSNQNKKNDKEKSENVDQLVQDWFQALEEQKRKQANNKDFPPTGEDSDGKKPIIIAGSSK